MLAKAQFALLVSVAFVAAGCADRIPTEPTSTDAQFNRVAGAPWSPCYKDVGAAFGVSYECASFQVPLDYERPNGAVISLAVVRLPAADPANRIGSIILNPGGPGGSGVDFALSFGPVAGLFWGQAVRDGFDIVGFDPRGVQRSTGIKCFGNERQASQVFAPVAFPLTPEEEALFMAGDALLAGQCAQRGNKVSDHMATADVARDMDGLRDWLGDDQITYVGLSYGSYLGVTYANLFPDRVRALVVDGVLDPIAWANVDGAVPFSTRLRSDAGAQATLERFFELCDAAAAGNCALAPDSKDRFAALADQLLTAPIPITDPASGQTVLFTYQDLIGSTLGTLYNPFSYATGAQLMALLEAQASAAAVGAAYGELERVNGLVNKRGFPNYVNFAEAFPAVACEDSNNPASYAVWSSEGAAADADSYFGRIWTWASSPCAQWPLADGERYTGPFTAATANPVLAIGNLYDPATRYEGAQTVRALLPNSALLSVDVPGHTSLGASACAGYLTGQYLLDPSLASAIDGLLCPVEFNPFDLVAASAGAQSMGASLRAQLLPHIAYRPLR
jgi:pimeloyl-ACP methyl ester carboxylesterase